MLIPHDNAVLGAGIDAEGLQIRHKPRPEGIQVNVAHQLQKVGFFLAQNRLVPVLKKSGRACGAFGYS